MFVTIHSKTIERRRVNEKVAWKVVGDSCGARSESTTTRCQAKQRAQLQAWSMRHEDPVRDLVALFVFLVIIVLFRSWHVRHCALFSRKLQCARLVRSGDAAKVARR